MTRHNVDAWLAREAAVRKGAAGAGMMGLENLSACSGLETLQQMLAGTLPYPPICDTLGFMLVEVDKGRAVFQGTPRHEHYNPLGSVHGGFHATLLDSCLACAVHSMLEAGQGYTTLELKVNYVRALTDRAGPVRAEGKAVHVGKQAGTAEGRLYDASGKLYAHASTTCLIFSL